MIARATRASCLLAVVATTSNLSEISQTYWLVGCGWGVLVRLLTCSPSALHHVIGVIVPESLAILRVVVFEREVGFVCLEVRLCELCPELGDADFLIFPL